LKDKAFLFFIIQNLIAMKLKITFVVFLSLWLQTVLAQNRSQLIAKRWATALVIEQLGNQYDTLLKIHDCQNEFIEFFGNSSFISPTIRTEGKWKIEQDSILQLTYRSGRKYKTAFIQHLSKDSLTVRIQDDARHAFIEIYTSCGLNDTTYIDSRQEYSEIQGVGIMTGALYSKVPYLELGIAKSKLNWNNVFFGVAGSIEVAPFQNMYGLSSYIWSERTLMYGVGAVAYTNFEEMWFGMRPMVGLSGLRWLQNSYSTLHLAYGYTFLFGEKNAPNINQHNFILRMYIPIQKRTKYVRKLVNQDGLGY
jgi:hypothetical protein